MKMIIDHYTVSDYLGYKILFHTETHFNTLIFWNIKTWGLNQFIIMSDDYGFYIGSPFISFEREIICE